MRERSWSQSSKCWGKNIKCSSIFCCHCVEANIRNMMSPANTCPHCSGSTQTFDQLFKHPSKMAIQQLELDGIEKIRKLVLTESNSPEFPRHYRKYEQCWNIDLCGLIFTFVENNVSSKTEGRLGGNLNGLLNKL